VDQPLSRTQVSGTGYGRASYYLADGLGSVVAVTNNVDASVQTQRFDAWGNKLSGNVPQNLQYGYTGHEPDETGLVYYRARYYSPQMRRFISRDPAGLAGGLNAYAYVGSNPINRVDPMGLMPASPLQMGSASSYYEAGGVLIADAGGGSGLQYLGAASGSKFIDRAEQLAADNRNNLVAAIPFVGLDLYKQGAGDSLKAFDPIQGMIDAYQGIQSGDYWAAGLAGVGTVFKPLRSSEEVLSVAKKAPVVIGESMNRVIPAAEEIGGHIYKPIGSWATEKQIRWAQEMKRQVDTGVRDLVDIGYDAARRVRSEAYEIERRIFYGDK
jgi:RHS repeat-associated protein